MIKLMSRSALNL
jgi:hypothetical protein